MAVDFFVDDILQEPLLQSEVDPATAVYSVDFIKNNLCAQDTQTLTIVEFDACINYINYAVWVDYISIFLGLALGFIMAKAVGDAWD